MKRILKTISIAAFAAFFVQTASAQIKFGARLGGNLANMTFSEDPEFDQKSIIGIQAGAILEVPIKEKIALRTGLELQMKGTKFDFSELGIMSEATLSPMYVQVPALLACNGSMFFAGIGPYVGFGVAGNFKTKATDPSTGINIDESESIEFGSTEDDFLSALDFGGRIEAGVKLGQLRIGANYDLGLANTIPKDSRDGDTARHRVLGIWFGYIF